MLKWRQGQDALVKKAVAWPRKWIRTTKATSKPEQGMNFTVNIDLWFCNDDFCKKPEDKKCYFCHFSMLLKTVIFVLIQIQKVIFCKKHWLFCVYWISQFEGLSTQYSKLTVKAMFAWLRKLQCFKAIESFTAGFGRHSRQWVKGWTFK